MVRQSGVWDGHCSLHWLQAHGNMEQKVDGVEIALVLSVRTDTTPPVTHIPHKGHTTWNSHQYIIIQMYSDTRLRGGLYSLF